MGETIADKLKSWAANLDIEAAALENNVGKFPVTKADLLAALPRAAENAKFKEIEVQTKTPADLVAETVTSLGFVYGVAARRVAVGGINSGGDLYNKVLDKVESKATGIAREWVNDDMAITQAQYGELYTSLKGYQSVLKNPAATSEELAAAQNQLTQTSEKIFHSAVNAEKMEQLSEKVESGVNKVEDKLEKAKSFFKSLKKTSAENRTDSARALQNSGLASPEETGLTGVSASAVHNAVAALKARESSYIV